MAVLQIVGDELFLENFTMGRFPFKSPNDALQAGGVLDSVQTAPINLPRSFNVFDLVGN